ncbi:tail collar fiber protein [Vibrio phage EniLVp02]
MSNIGTNITKHVLDEAGKVGFTVAGTPFPVGTENVQQALNLIDASALFPAPSVPYATQQVEGAVRFATPAELAGLELQTVALSPSHLGQYQTAITPATTDQQGLLKLSNALLMGINTTNVDTAVTPGRLSHWATQIRIATETSAGLAKLATLAEALDATNNTNTMTPAKVIASVNKWSIKRPDATTTVKGGIRLATPNEVKYNARSVAVTPKSLQNKTASAYSRGLFTINEVITPGNMASFAASDTVQGFFTLEDTLTSSATNVALTAAQGLEIQANKIGLTGGRIEGTLECNGFNTEIIKLVKVNITGGWVYQKQTISATAVTPDGYINPEIGTLGRPVGSLYMSTSSMDPATLFGGRWTRINGRTLVGAGSTTDTRGERRTFRGSSTGGSYRTKLTESQIPEHKHAQWGESSYFLNQWKFGHAPQYGRNRLGGGSTDTDNYLYYNSPVGNSQPHNNTQPYTALYMWRRIS